MTERRRSSLWTTATLSLGAFLIVLALVAWQLHAGEDPALGGGNATQAPEKQVVVRRVIVTRVIPPAGLAAASGSSTSPAPASAPAAPAPAPPPPPAPVTRAS